MMAHSTPLSSLTRTRADSAYSKAGESRFLGGAGERSFVSVESCKRSSLHTPDTSDRKRAHLHLSAYVSDC